eukprot:jgi/Bigna1/85489/estExt_fgenesh1_pg.C_40195
MSTLAKSLVCRIQLAVNALSRRRRNMSTVGAAARFHAATSAESLPDPHNVSNKLDDETIEAIVTRLEERGEDPVFRSLFNYFDMIPSDARVLEVGCGTGVMSRALAKHPGFEGSITGVDQCIPFLEVAKKKAEEAGCDMSVTNFIEGDAHDLQTSLTNADLKDGFDVVVMHTLLSHATHPKTVLRSAAEVAGSGALLFVMDGDYEGLSFGHSEKWIGRQMDQALVEATFKRPDIIRHLVANIDRCGWSIKDSKGKFFASCNYYTLVAQKQVNENSK